MRPELPPRGCVGWKPDAKPEHRTEVKPRKAGRPGQASAIPRRPTSSRGRTVVGTVRREDVHTLPLEDSEVRASGRAQEGNDAGPTPKESGIISQ